ncbi:MAG: copper amine oxidase N-terminal domain-containing protein, partial [Cellulosilyticaceae bacterium]
LREKKVLFQKAPSFFVAKFSNNLLLKQDRDEAYNESHDQIRRFYAMTRHFKRRWILVMAIGASSMVQSVHAQSANRISRVVTVGENTLLQRTEDQGIAPVLVITLEDALMQGSRFYLGLEQATWAKEVNVTVEGNSEVVIRTQKISETELEVIVDEGNLEAGQVMRIPMVAVVSKGEAQVRLDHNNTSLSSGTLTFANTSTAKGRALVSEVPKVPEGGVIAPISIEEAYADQFKNDSAKEKGSILTLTLEEHGYVWDEASLKQAAIVGIKSFEGISSREDVFRLIGSQTLEVRLPESIAKESRTGKGALTIKGLGVSASAEARRGSVHVTIEGAMVETQTIEVLESADYEVKLLSKAPTQMLTGDEHTLTFTLEENMAGALLKDRSLDFILSAGELIMGKDGKVALEIGETTYSYPPILKEGRCIGFEMNDLTKVMPDGQLKYDMKLEIKLPVTLEAQQLVLKVQGRGLPNEKELTLKVAAVMPKVIIETQTLQLSEGKRDQVGGCVTLSESQAGSLKEGDVIRLEFLHEGMSLAKLPVIEVVTGDLGLGEPKEVVGGIEVPITKASKKASTVEIKHFGVHTTGVIADGYYDMKIGGSALTPFEDDEMTMSDWIMVNVGPKNRRHITFRLGEEAYNLNGKYYHVEVPPYLEEGRVMVPLAYVVEALGISKEQVKWDKATQKITIYDAHVIELELGSTIMKVDGKKVYMPVATQSKNGYTMVPMSELAKALEVEVSWDEKLQTATFVAK